MKKSNLMGILMAGIIVPTFSAQALTKNITTPEEFIECTKITGNTCMLSNDIALKDTAVLTENLTVDLNGHNITVAKERANAFNVNSKEAIAQDKKTKVIITGKGSVNGGKNATNAIRVYGAETDKGSDTTYLQIDKDVTIKSDGYAVFVTHNNKHAFGVTVKVNGTLIGGKYVTTSGTTAGGSAMYINGNAQDKVGNFPQIIIENATLSSPNPAIYGAGYGKWTIKNSKLTGEDSGIGLKSGIFDITDSVITATGIDETDTTESYGNGINSSGAAIQLESNDGYAKSIKLNINGGTLESKNGPTIFEYADAKTKETAVDTITLNNVKLVAGEGKKQYKVTENFTNKFAKKVNVAAKLENGTVTVDKTTAFAGETVKLTVKAVDKYELDTLTVLNGKEVVKVTNNEFAMPNGDVTISATFKKIINKPVVDNKNKVDVNTEVKDVTVGLNDEKANDVLLDSLKDSKIDTTNKNVEVKVEIENQATDKVDNKVVDVMNKTLLETYKTAKTLQFFDVSLNVLDKDTNKSLGSLDKLNKNIELTVMLPNTIEKVKEGFTRKYYVIRYHDGKAEILNTVVAENGKSLTFKTDSFSTYALAYEDTKVEPEKPVTPEKPEEKNPNTGDNIVKSVVASILSLGFISAAVVYLKKQLARK